MLGLIQTELKNLKAIYSLNRVASNRGKEGGILLNPESPIEGFSAAKATSTFSEFRSLSEEMKAGNVSVLRV
ncbi:MAG: hypothetical protein CM1200mP3_05920 [Chloroflexota bacterium]|nr:MAG: hypothetical protein CM1200mP3_05920 [Chloroflexota bacterium]